MGLIPCKVSSIIFDGPAFVEGYIFVAEEAEDDGNGVSSANEMR